MEDESEESIADERPFVRVPGTNFHPRKVIGAARRPVETSENVHQGALPGTAWPHYSHQLSRVNDEVHVTEGMHNATTNYVAPRDPAKLGERRGRCAALGHRKVFHPLEETEPFLHIRWLFIDDDFGAVW